jgi:nucleotide-binding universal stress UspA family protein
VKKMPGIIVGIDGSDHSRRALEWAMREAALRRVPLTVLTVHEIVVGYWGYLGVDPAAHAAAEHTYRMAQVEVDKVLDELGDARPESVTVRSVNGGPARQLLTAARHADMIVVGSRGAGGFARLLMGSVSTQVSHHARCPVVIVPTEDHG